MILKRYAFYTGKQYNDNYIMVAALWSSMRLLWPQWLVKLWLLGSAGKQRWFSWQLHCSKKNFFMCSWCCHWCDLAFLVLTYDDKMPSFRSWLELLSSLFESVWSDLKECLPLMHFVKSYFVVGNNIFCSFLFLSFNFLFNQALYCFSL